MNRIAWALLVVLGLSGCWQPEPIPFEPPKGEPGVKPAAPVDDTSAVMGKELKVGDVEQTVTINMSLSQRSQARNITEEVLADKLERVRLLTININPPFPNSLWLDTVVKAKNDFHYTPVVLRGSYLRNEKESLGDIKLVLAGRFSDDYNLQPIDVLAGLEQVPETMLISMDLEALLMPPGTDPAAIKPDTATTPPERITRAMYYKTAVRINFNKGGGAQASESAAAVPLSENSAANTAAPPAPSLAAPPPAPPASAQ